MLRVLHHLSNHWRHAYDIHLDFRSSFCCEIDCAKRAFLVAEHDPQVMFENVADLHAPTCNNVCTNERVMVPFADAFAFGFSCASRSPANARSRLNAHCIQQRRADTATFNTYEGGLGYMRRARPPLCIMENVKELEQRPQTGVNPASDAETILQDLREAGYTATYIKFNASEYGSWSNRVRIYFVAYDGVNRSNTKRLQTFKTIVNAMRFENDSQGDDFILPGSELSTWVASDPPVKRARETTRDMYKSEHMDIFGTCGMEWPPAIPDGTTVGDDGIDYSFMTTRMREVLWFLHRRFPVPSERVGQWEATLGVRVG